MNFFGDNDTNKNTDNAPANESLDQIFNGVTLENNAQDKLTVAINSSRDVDLGATSYTLGQLTTHGVKTMSIDVKDEIKIADGAVASTTTTTIGNIFAKNLETLTATTTGSLTLGTVSGNGTNNNLKTVTTTGVLGDFSAAVIALGDNAVVTLGEGKNTFNALGSAGKNVTITSGKSNDTITGTGQSDTINSGAGNDTVSADRGDNVISAGAGDDTLTAKDGNDTYSVGSGIDTVTDNLSTGLDATKATNTVTGNGTIVSVHIDDIGDGTDPADVIQYLAVVKVQT